MLGIKLFSYLSMRIYEVVSLTIEEILEISENELRATLINGTNVRLTNFGYANDDKYIFILR